MREPGQLGLETRGATAGAGVGMDEGDGAASGDEQSPEVEGE